jgi:N-methylhydantoinase A
MSGPASGVMAAAATLARAGLKNGIAYDMGGTSTDVALIHGGVPEVSAELTIDYGLPIHVPMVDVRTVGAGGGSIAGLNAAGMLKVGPESAGSMPGPICYGRGGTAPTITDANVVLGRLDPGGLLAVRDPVGVERIRAIFDETLARPLGLGIEEAAAAAVRLANTHMAGAIRMVSLSRGHDPRDFVLFAFGGAGPLHAAAIARELGIPEVLVPARPGLTNALGCLVADLRQDLVNTLNAPLETVDMDEFARVLEDQRARGIAINASEQSEIIETRVAHSADMQFRGQTHLIRVPLPSARMTREDLQKRFEAAYDRRFQVQLPEIQGVVVNLNTTVVGVRRPFPLEALHDALAHAANAAGAIIGERRLWIDGGWHAARIYARERLPFGATFAGPAIVQQIDATTYVPPGATARIDDIGNLRLTVSQP